MADQYTPPPPQIIVCSGNDQTRSQIISYIENLDKNYLVSGFNEEWSHEFLLATAKTDLVIIALEPHDDFDHQYRKLIKISTILGVRKFLLIQTGNDNPADQQSNFETVKQEFNDYLEYLAQNNCGNIVGIAMYSKDRNVNWCEDLSLDKNLPQLLNDQSIDSASFRLSVASTPNSNEASGIASSGSIHPGDKVVILPSAIRADITSLTYNGNVVDRVQNGQCAKLTLSANVSLEPGDMICSAGDPVEAADQFETTILWLSKDPLMAGRHYDFRSMTNLADASITNLKYSINVDLHEHVAANHLEQGEIGVSNISLSKRIPFEPHDVGRETSQFTLIDKETGETAGIGAIHFALRRASNVHWQALDVTRKTRASLKGQKPAILWFTGLSGSGKSAIANIVEKKLVSQGCHTYTLDGDNIRHGLNRDLGFTDVDRIENIRRIGEVSRLMADCGLICLVSFISPFRSERQLARELAEDGEFVEIHVDTPLEVAEARDVKGLYKKARAGEIKNFTGIDSPYEPPENPEIRVDTIANSAEEAAELILESLKSWGMIVSR